MIRLTPLPPKEAIAYFQAKGFKPTFHYLDIAAQEHQAAFTVAKMMQLDLLADTRDAIMAALSVGDSLNTFQETLIPMLQAKGWWGQKKMADPKTGEVKDVQLGSPRRLRTIYTTNIRRAHAEGQWDRIQEVKEDFPYLQYDGLNSRQPRESHRPFDGMVLPVDDPFWTYHFPPREYNCKCRVIQLDGNMLEARGLKVSPSPQISKAKFENKRTGEVMQVPAGVHPAFNFKMGQGRAKVREALIQEMNLTDTAMARAMAAGMVGSDMFETWYQAVPASNKHGPSRELFPVAVLTKVAKERLGASAQTVTLSDWTAGKQKANHADLTPDDYRKIQQVIDQGEMLKDADNALTFVMDQPGGYTVVVTTISSGSEVYLKSMRRLSSQTGERKTAIEKLRKKAKAWEESKKK